MLPDLPKQIVPVAEKVDKRNRVRSLVDQAQRRLKDVTLDFGNEFTRSYRRQIESLSTEIIDALEKNDDRRIDSRPSRPTGCYL
jgi:molecular chaperone DnaK